MGALPSTLLTSVSVMAGRMEGFPLPHGLRKVPVPGLPHFQSLLLASRTGTCGCAEGSLLFPKPHPRQDLGLEKPGLAS